MNARGFTLVEMLVALVAFGLVAAAAMSLLNATLRNQQVFDGATATLRELQAARAIMRADFAQATTRPVRDADGRLAPFNFAPEQAKDQPALAFVRRGWDNAGGVEARGSLQYVEYLYNGTDLIRRARPYLDPTPDTPSYSTTILRNVAAFALTFQAQGTWSDRWQPGPATRALPDAIAVTTAVAGLGPIRQAFLIGAQP